MGEKIQEKCDTRRKPGKSGGLVLAQLLSPEVCVGAQGGVTASVMQLRGESGRSEDDVSR